MRERKQQKIDAQKVHAIYERKCCTHAKEILKTPAWQQLAQAKVYPLRTK